MLRHLDISTNCSSSWTVTLHKQFVNCQCIVYFGLELSSAKQKANIAAHNGGGEQAEERVVWCGVVSCDPSPSRSPRTICAVRCDRYARLLRRLLRSSASQLASLSAKPSRTALATPRLALVVHIKRLFCIKLQTKWTCSHTAPKTTLVTQN